jgi:deoxyuridine 5'-triphosphate nucleotidohydrolase
MTYYNIIYKMSYVIDIKFKLDEGAWLPKKGSMYAAGYDIHAIEDTIVPIHSRKLVSTGVKLDNMPIDHYIQIAPRSGLAVRSSIDVGAGVVDPDYRGEIKVLLINNGKNDFCIQKHDRIAQLIIKNFANNTLLRGVRDNGEIIVESDIVNERGEGGFGSTGLHGSPLNNV